jgi:hypothetical protein
LILVLVGSETSLTIYVCNIYGICGRTDVTVTLCNQDIHDKEIIATQTEQEVERKY